MSALFENLKTVYNGSGINADVSADGTHMRIMPRIQVEGEYICLEIHIMEDANNEDMYHFACFGLGRQKLPSISNLQKIVALNKKNPKIKLQMDGDSNYALTFDRTFKNYRNGGNTIEEVMKAVLEIKYYVEDNYYELKSIVKKFE